jgi:hypothetical protein
MGETVGVMPQAAGPAPSSAPATPEKPKGAVGIWIGVLLIIGGIALGIILVVVGAKSLLSGFDDLQRVPIQGGGVVRFEESGTQTIYAERPSTSGGTSFSTNSYSTFVPDVGIRVIGPDGGDVAVSRGGASETYNYDGREGVKIGSFFAEAGEYRIVTQVQDGGATGRYSTIAVGNGLELSGIGAILGGIFGGGLVVVIGIIVVIVFSVRRSRSKKRINQGTYPGGPGGGWPAAPGYAGAGYAGAGYGAPQAAPGGGWPPASSNPGWVPPPVGQPGPPASGPTWSPPAPPAPQAPQQPTWQPPASDAPSWQPPGDAPTSEAPPADPLAPSWDPPPPPSGGDGNPPS